MDNIDAALSMLGLATKAGRTVNGSEMCENAIKKEKVFLLLSATDASPKTLEPILKLCMHHAVPVRQIADRETLGRFSGKDSRAAVGVMDKGFAARIIEIIDGVPAEKKPAVKKAAVKKPAVKKQKPKPLEDKRKVIVRR